MNRIAVIGAACRFPGGIDQVDVFWAMLKNESQTSAPANRRFEAGAIGLDTAFFGDDSGKVGRITGPQQLLRELAWEAFEQAGRSMPAVSGQTVGIYIGGRSGEETRAADLVEDLARTYDLRGPALGIDARGAASLAAFAAACADLRAGLCDLALVGGVDLAAERDGAGMILLAGPDALRPGEDPIWAGVRASGAAAEGQAEDAGSFVADVCTRFDLAPDEIGTPLQAGDLSAGVGLDMAAGIAALLATLQRIAPGEEAAQQSVAVFAESRGGVLALAVLTAPPVLAVVPEVDGRRDGFPHLLPLSARSPEALRASAARMAHFLEEGDAPLVDILFTAQQRRAHLPHRLVALGPDRAALAGQLTAYAEGAADGPGLIAAKAKAEAEADGPVLVYGGLSDEDISAAQTLYRTNVLFRARLDEADTQFEERAGYGVLEALLAPETALASDPKMVEIAGFLVQFGLTALLTDAGVRARALIGCGGGEVTAAWACGALGLGDALEVLAQRARLWEAGQLTAYLPVALSHDACATRLKRAEGALGLAPASGGALSYVTGSLAALLQLRTALQAEGVPVGNPVAGALDAPEAAEAAGETLRLALQDLTLRPQALPVYSAVCGALADADAFSPTHWGRSISAPLALAPVLQAADEGGLMLEMAAAPALSRLATHLAHPVAARCAMAAGARAQMGLHQAVAWVHASGAPLDWSQHCPAGRVTTLPSYPWQRDHIWTAEAMPRRTQAVQDAMTETGSGLEAANTGPGRLQVAGATLVPPGALVDLVMQYARGKDAVPAQIHLGGLPPVAAQDALAVSQIFDKAAHAVRLNWARDGKNEGQSDGDERMLVQAQLEPMRRPPAGAIPPTDLVGLRDGAGPALEVSAHYARLQQLGLNWGPDLRGLCSLFCDPATGRALGQIATPPRKDSFDPVLTEAALVTALACFEGGLAAIPTRIARVDLFTDQLPQEIWCAAELVWRRGARALVDLRFFDAEGEALGGLFGVELAAVPGAAAIMQDQTGGQEPLHLLNSWHAAPQPAEPAPAAGRWLLVGDVNRIGTQIMAQIEQLGAVEYHLAQSGEQFLAGDQQSIDDLVGRLDGLAGVIFTLGLEAGGMADPLGETAAQTLACFADALERHCAGAHPRALVITCAAVMVSGADAPAQPAQSALAGITQALASRNARWTCVDIAPHAEAADWAVLAREALCDSDDALVLVRDGHRMTNMVRVSDRLAQRAERAVVLGREDMVRFEWCHAPGKPALILVADAPKQDDPAALCLALEALSWPAEELQAAGLDKEDDTPGQMPPMAVVGRCLGGAAHGQRVAGFVDARPASHVTLPPERMALVHLDEETPAHAALAALAQHGVALHAVQQAGLEPGARALVLADRPEARAVGAALERAGVQVSWLGRGAPALQSAADAALARETGGAGFDAVVAPGALAERVFGRMLRPGGVLIDSSADARPIRLPSEAGHLVRMDLALALRDQAAFAKTLAAALALAGAKEENDLSMTRFARELLEAPLDLPDLDMRVDIRLDLHGQQVPVALDTGPVRLRGDRCYLLAGVFDGAGPELARWMVARGARYLVLPMRSQKVSAPEAALLDELRAAGVELALPREDVRLPAEAGALLARIGADGPPLGGVMIAGDAIGNGLLTAEALAAQMRAAPFAAHALDRACAEHALEFFVMTAPLGGMLGQGALPADAAAEGALGGIAWRRRARGQHGLVLNLTAGEGATAGLGSTLDQALRHGVTQIALLPEDALRHRFDGEAQIWPVPPALEAMQAHLALERDGAIAEGQEPGRFGAHLAQMPAEARLPWLTGRITRAAARVMKMEPDGFDLHESFAVQGLDLPAAVRLALALRRDMETETSLAALLGAGSIEQIAQDCLAQIHMQAAE